MNSSQFVLLAFANINTFVISCLVAFVLYYMLYRKEIYSIFDPFLQALFASSMGFATVFFLCMMRLMQLKYSILYFGTQFLFFSGFKINKPFKPRINDNLKLFSLNYHDQLLFHFYVLISLIVIISQIAIYMFKGIPLLSSSRLNVVGNDMLFIIILRLRNALNTPWVILTFYYTKNKYNLKKGMALIMLLIIIVFSFLAGSKSALLSIASFYYLYSVYLLKMNDTNSYLKLKKYTSFLFLFCVIGALIVIIFSEDTSNSLYFLLYRILISGDIYFMSFPNGVIENFISSQNWFINLFASPLSIMRLISAESVPEPLGFLLTEYYTKVNLFKGPNSRHNVFGYVYIGYYGAFVFSFILGYLTSFVRNKLYIIFSATPIGMVFYIGILMGVFELEGDFYLGLSNIINIIPLFLIWCICCIVFSKHLNIIFPFKINSLCFKS